MRVILFYCLFLLLSLVECDTHLTPNQIDLFTIEPAGFYQAGFVLNDVQRPFVTMGCSGSFSSFFQVGSVASPSNFIEVNTSESFRSMTVFSAFVSPINEVGNYSLTMRNDADEQISCSVVYNVGDDVVFVPGVSFDVVLAPPSLKFVSLQVDEHSMVTCDLYAEESDLDFLVGYAFGMDRYPTVLDEVNLAQSVVQHDIAKFEIVIPTTAPSTMRLALFENVIFPMISQTKFSATVSTTKIAPLITGVSTDFKNVTSFGSDYFSVFAQENYGMYVEVTFDHIDLVDDFDLFFAYDAPSEFNTLPVEWEDVIFTTNARKSFLINHAEDREMFIRIRNNLEKEFRYSIVTHVITSYELYVNDDAIINHNPGTINIFEVLQENADVLHLSISSDIDLDIFLSRETRVPSAEHSDWITNIDSSFFNGQYITNILIPRDDERRPLYFSIQQRHGNDGVGIYEISMTTSTVFTLDEFNNLGGVISTNSFDFYQWDIFPEDPYVLYFTIDSTFDSINAIVANNELPTDSNHYQGEDFIYRTTDLISTNPIRSFSEGIMSSTTEGLWTLRLSRSTINNETDRLIQYQLTTYMVTVETIPTMDAWTVVHLSERKIAFVKFTVPTENIGQDLFFWLENFDDFEIYLNPGSYATTIKHITDIEIGEVDGVAAVKFTPETTEWYATIISKSFENVANIALKTEGVSTSLDLTGNIIIPIWLAIVFIGSFVIALIALAIILGPVTKSCKGSPHEYQMFQ